MLYEKLLEEVREEKHTKDFRSTQIKKLQEYIKTERHLYDDHGSAIIGSRDRPPKYPT